MTNETTSMDFEIDKTVGNEGEYGVKFNEPTTGEIVRALGNPETLDQESLYYCSKVAADRLESQEEEKKISRHLIEMQSNVITELTARAEQAEKWAAAAIADIERLRLKKFTLCPICEFEDMIGCAHKNHCTGYKQFKWRGLPQDGGK